jgi:hypothetical protein
MNQYQEIKSSLKFILNDTYNIIFLVVLTMKIYNVFLAQIYAFVPRVKFIDSILKSCTLFCQKIKGKVHHFVKINEINRYAQI